MSGKKASGIKNTLQKTKAVAKKSGNKSVVSNKNKKALKKAAKTARNNKPLTVVIIIVVILILIAFAGLVYTGTLTPLINTINHFIQNNLFNTDNIGNNSGNALDTAEGDLIMHFVDVGQGDFIVLQLPDGKNMIIDGGDRYNNVKNKVESYLTDLNIITLDYVLLTHTDADHCGSLDDAINLADNVHKVFFPKIKTQDAAINENIGLGDSAVATITTNVYSEFVASILAASYDFEGERKSAEYEFLIDEIVIDGGSYRMTMYAPSANYYETSLSNSKAINDVSPICVLEYADRRVIFTGDANSSNTSTSAEKRFLEAKAAKGYSSYDSDILKVAHHGGKDSSGADFLDFITAEYAIICVGERSGTNSSGNYEGFLTAEYYSAGYTFTTCGNGAYDHPHRDVAGIPINGEGRLAASGISKLYRSDTHGDIMFIISDNGVISVSTQKTASVEANTIVFVMVIIVKVDTTISVDMYYEERLRVF